MTAKLLADFVSSAALYALSFEASVTPKPGLVDQNNTGSHEDMTLSMLLESAKAISPFIGQCALSGFETKSSSYDDAFSHLQKIGLQAENAMNGITCGVNTHKGAIYCLCLLSGAFGRLLDAEPVTPDSLCRTASLLAKKACISSLSNASRAPVTHGDIAYKNSNLQGARGEALAGYPSILTLALPALENAFEKGYTENDAGVKTLLTLISKVDDTCIYSRGGYEGLLLSKSLATKALEGDFIEEAARLDSIFIQKRLSPGGCADLLSAAMFIHRITNIKREEYLCE